MQSLLVAANGHDAEESGRVATRPGFYLTMLGLVAGLGIGFVSIGALGLGDSDGTAIALSVAGGLASFMVGGILGFLFGVPRTPEPRGDQSVGLNRPPRRRRFLANTNLEQVSDWLTKILVGVGLTQFRAIGHGLGTIADRFGQALANDGGPAATAMALSLLLVTAVCGFLFFYLWARIYVEELFGLGDRDREIPPPDSTEGAGQPPS